MNIRATSVANPFKSVTDCCLKLDLIWNSIYVNMKTGKSLGI